jgi:hypothetical protein
MGPMVDSGLDILKHLLVNTPLNIAGGAAGGARAYLKHQAGDYAGLTAPQKILRYLGNIGTGAATGNLLPHRVLDIGITKALRNSPFARDYYANATREGMSSHFTGEDLMPQYRRALGNLINPSASGVANYEIGKEVAHHLAGQVEKLTGKRPQSLNELMGHESVQKLIGDRLVGKVNTLDKFHSPLTRDIFGALNKDLPKSPLIEKLKTPGFLGVGGVGPDQQRFAGRTGMLASSLMGGLVGGAVGGDPLHGAMTNLLLQAPEYGGMAMVNRAGANPLISKILGKAVDMKKQIAGTGVLDEVTRQAQPFNPSGTRNLIPEYRSLDTTMLMGPLAGEVYNAGRDLGRVAHMTQSGMLGVENLHSALQDKDLSSHVPNVLNNIYKNITPTSAAANTPKRPLKYRAEQLMRGLGRKALNIFKSKDILPSSTTTGLQVPPTLTDFRDYRFDPRYKVAK